MLRDIITIDEEKCDGCGACVPDCPEGALQIIDGKARLVGDLFCDGLGACISGCPTGALMVEKREAGVYDERAVMENVVKQGPGVIAAHLKHLEDHGESKYAAIAMEYLKEKGIPAPARALSPGHGHGGGCPGSAAMHFKPDAARSAPAGGPGRPSELAQWPVQLALINPSAPYFEGSDLLVVADCVPPACGEFHERYLRGRSMVMFCPKLDRTGEEYVDRMAAILANNRISSITVARMEVPCCGGATALLRAALEKSGKNIPVNEAVITVRGESR